MKTKNFSKMKEKIIRKMLFCTLCLILFLLMGSLIFAEEQRFYNLYLHYDEGVITFKNIAVTPGALSPTIQPEEGYKLELLSFAGDVLDKITFEIPLTFHIEVVDPETGELSGEIIQLNETDFSLRILYFPNGKTIDIFDPDGNKVLEVDVGYFAKVCGDNICQEHENYFVCPQDCPNEIKEEISGLKIKINFLFIGIGALVLIGLTGLIIQLIRLKSEKRVEIMNIEEYIINTLRKGYSFSQIRKELLKEGFNKKEIEKAVKFATNILKSDRKKEIISLEEYIMNTKRYGYSFTQIRNELLREGWNKEEVDKAFEFVVKRKK